MPLARYNRYVGNAAKLRRTLIERYGKRKGDRVFYGVVNKAKRR